MLDIRSGKRANVLFKDSSTSLVRMSRLHWLNDKSPVETTNIVSPTSVKRGYHKPVEQGLCLCFGKHKSACCHACARVAKHTKDFIQPRLIVPGIRRLKSLLDYKRALVSPKFSNATKSRKRPQDPRARRDVADPL